MTKTLLLQHQFCFWFEVKYLLSFPVHYRCGSQEGDDNAHSMDTTKITQLGFPQFKSLEKMFDDCIKSFQDKGFL